MPIPPAGPPPVNIPIGGGGLLVAGPAALDSEVGAVTGTLEDGTEYRQALKSPAVGTVYVGPDGRTWTAVREQVVNGKVTVSPTALQWKCLPETFSSLIVRLIDLIRRPLPSVFPSQPLPAGQVGPEITIDAGSMQRLFQAGAVQGGPVTQLWSQGDSELLVLAGQVKLQLDDGLVLVSIPVTCDQVGSAVVQVPFAVGGKTAPAGMVVATEEKPRGPEAIVKIWGEGLMAFAWHALLTVITKVAARAGVDADGAGLIPAAITAGTDGLRILTQARQSFDRVAL
jgi:hypothetical protein